MFDLVPESRFGEEHIIAHPVWARYDEPDQIDEIVGWGIDRNLVLQKLAETHDGNDHAMFPVLQTDPLPDSLDIYIRAEFITSDQRRLTGYLSGIEANVITLFWAKDQFCFIARGLADLNAA